MGCVQAAAALQADRMRRALEARAVVAQVAEQKEAGRAAMAANQVLQMQTASCWAKLDDVQFIVVSCISKVTLHVILHVSLQTRSEV